MAKPVLIIEKGFHVDQFSCSHMCSPGAWEMGGIVLFLLFHLFRLRCAVKQTLTASCSLLCSPLFTGQQYHLSSISIFQISLRMHKHTHTHQHTNTHNGREKNNVEFWLNCSKTVLGRPWVFGFIAAVPGTNKLCRILPQVVLLVNDDDGLSQL